MPVRDLPRNVGVSLSSLPISPGLRRRIEDWDASFQSEEPGSDFVESGRRIARDLARELGRGYDVVYLDNKDVTVLDSHPKADELYWSADPD